MFLVMLIAGIVIAVVAQFVVKPAGDRAIDAAMDPVADRFNNGEIGTVGYLAEAGTKGCATSFAYALMAFVVLGAIFVAVVAALAGGM